MTTPTPGQKPRPWYAKKRHMLWYVPILAFVALMVLAVNSPPAEPEPVAADEQAADDTREQYVETAEEAWRQLPPDGQAGLCAEWDADPHSTADEVAQRGDLPDQQIAFSVSMDLLGEHCAAQQAAAEPAPEPEPEPEPEPAPEPAPEPEAEPAETAGQENARQTAEDYLDYSPFSKSGLIEQLEYEGYDTADAEYAVDNVEVNWRDQAALQAESYLEYDSFSRSGLIEQLEYEGFTTKQAAYGVDQVGL